MEINEADRRFLLQAFVSLVKIPSASSPNAVSKPTAEGEILILKRIERLLRAWGVNPVFYDNGYLLLRVPASDGYEERLARGEKQRQLSKEFVREWLMDNGFQGKEGLRVPEMTPEVVANIHNRYIELYEHITGSRFEKAETPDVLGRIERNVDACLASLLK